MKNVSKFKENFHIAVKILTPVVFFVLSCWPAFYPLAGVMFLAVLFDYALEYFVKE